jgi:lysophospholipase L1-like esterase
MASYTLNQHEYQILDPATGTWGPSRQDNMALLSDGRHRISGLSYTIPVRGLRVRVIAISPNPAGDWLYNSEPFTVNSTSNFATLLADGDSLDWGALTSNPPYTGWSGVLYPQLDTAKFGQWVMRAVSGQTVQDMLNRQADTMASVNTALCKMVVVTMGGGANSLMTGVSVATLKAQRIQYIQNWRTWSAANGNFVVKIILESLTLNLKDYGGAYGVSLQNYEDRRQQANAEAFIGYSSIYGADYYINWDANAAMRDGRNPTYFVNDGQHFTDEGQRVRASIGKPYVEAAQAGTPLAPVATPTAPTLATPSFGAAAAGTNKIHLTRGDVANGTTYIVTRATDSSFTLNVVLIDMSGALEGEDSGLSAVTTYYYRLQASANGYSPSAYAVSSAKTLSTTPVMSSNILRAFISNQGVSNDGTTFRWVDSTGSGDALTTTNLAGVSVLPSVANGYPAVRLTSTQLNGLIQSGISGAQPFQLLVVARLPNSGTVLGMAGLGVDIDGGPGGTIADMLAYDSKLTIHTYSGQGHNVSVAPYINFGTTQVFGIRHDGTNARSYSSNPPSGVAESTSEPIAWGNLPNTVLRVGQSHTPGLPFNGGTIDVLAVVLQSLYDNPQWAQNIAALKYMFGIS